MFATLLAGEAWGRLRPSRWPVPADRRWQPGITVLIPERGTPDLLAETLAAAVAALARIAEPTQLLVVVNGAPEADYAALRERHPTAEWQFHPDALGFNGAIEAGLAAVRQPGVYLLNSDMRLDPDALAALLPYRHDEVFALTSQIHFADPTRRREETGWSDHRVVGAIVEMFERDPEPDSLVARGCLYPGGGSALLRSAILRDYVRGSRTFAPFYFEDADWGARAWSDGWECLFVPASIAWHAHRGTVRRYYDAAMVERIFARNRLQFELRHHWTEMGPKRAVTHVGAYDRDTQRELFRPAVLAALLPRRRDATVAARRGFDFRRVVDKYYPAPRPHRDSRPRVLVVSPFALYPPAHGGARRAAELLQRLADRVDLILLSDERSLYGRASEADFAAFRAVHLVEGRGDRPNDAPQSWPQRLARHAHPALRNELERLVAIYRPDIVQVEFMELAGLATQRQAGTRWLLSLHDVYLDGGEHDAAQREAIARFDAVSVCSAEDAALLGRPDARLIANGAVDRLAGYRPSPDMASLLFMGPFRYAPNLDGIRRFLADCWPRLQAAHPTLRLTILGGVDAGRYAQGDPLFDQPGVELIDRFVDPAPRLDAASLTINPQTSIRGSALKLVESLLAGRVCVSTADGARGFADSGLTGLVCVSDVPSMTAAIDALLRDPARRRALERADREAIRPLTWDGIADAQFTLYRDLIG